MEDNFTINFELLIRELLSEYECLVIPGFGGFVSYLESASIVSDKNLILPPYKKLSFNVNLNKNDGLLAHETVLKCGISYEEAIKAIHDLSNRWTSELEKNKFLELNTLGSFRKSKDGNILYEQAGEENYLLEAYGLSPVHAQAIEKDGISGKLKKELEQRKSAPNFNKKIRKYTIAGSVTLTLIALVIWSGLNIGYIGQKASELNVVFWGNSKESVNENPVEQIKKTVIQTPKIKEEEKEIVAVENKSDTTFDAPVFVPHDEVKSNSENSTVISSQGSNQYLIIAGCFMSLENAQNYVESLKKIGYNAHLAGNSKNGLFRVAYDSFSDMESANNVLENIRLEHNANAWICSIW